MCGDTVLLVLNALLGCTFLLLLLRTQTREAEVLGTHMPLNTKYSCRYLLARLGLTVRISLIVGRQSELSFCGQPTPLSNDRMDLSLCFRLARAMYAYTRMLV